MKMIGRQAVRVEIECQAFASEPSAAKKLFVVIILLKDRLSIVSPSDHVIKPTLYLNSWFSWHSGPC